MLVSILDIVCKRSDGLERVKQTILSFWAKNQSHHLILFFGISVGSKFQLQQTILIFGTNLQKKRYFHSKTQEMNVTIDICIF